MRVDPIRKIVFAVWAVVVGLLALVLLATFGDALAGWQWAAGLAAAALLLWLVLLWLRRRVPSRAMLELDLERGLVEQIPDDRAARLLLRRALVLRDAVEALDRAADDPRILGLIARIGPNPIGLAHAQEIRDAVERFRRAGKHAIACCETLGEGQSAVAGYLIASAFDEIHLQPVGDLGLTGFLAHQPFVRELLDRLGILPRLDHRERYKTAQYVFTEREMTEPHRESLEAVLGSQAEQVVEAIAQSRRLDTETARSLMDRGPFLGPEAVEARLVDGLDYPDRVRERMENGLRATCIELTDYLRRAGRPYRRGPCVALIHGVGVVGRGRTRFRRFPPGLTLGSDDVAAAFRAAARDRKVRAIVFRIDSPGGSAVASEAIWHAVRQAREAGKPVIASMSNLAGSGGYYIAAAADRIVAQPATLTGSVGVVSGKLVTREAWQKIGIHWGRVAVGEHADLWSPIEDFSETGWQKLQSALDETYRVFKRRVAEGRGLSEEGVEEVAQGRVWTGQMAQERGLVDELGGLRRAVELAREVADLPPGCAVRLAVFPPQRKLPPLPFLPGGTDSATAPATDPAAELLADAAPALRQLAPLMTLSQLDSPAGLVMPLGLWQDPILTHAAHTLAKR